MLHLHTWRETLACIKYVFDRGKRVSWGHSVCFLLQKWIARGVYEHCKSIWEPCFGHWGGEAGKCLQLACLWEPCPKSNDRFHNRWKTKVSLYISSWVLFAFSSTILFPYKARGGDVIVVSSVTWTVGSFPLFLKLLGLYMSEIPNTISFPYREALGNLTAPNNSSNGDSSSDSDSEISEDKRNWGGSP